MFANLAVGISSFLINLTNKYVDGGEKLSYMQVKMAWLPFTLVTSVLCCIFLALLGGLWMVGNP